MADEATEVISVSQDDMPFETPREEVVNADMPINVPAPQQDESREQQFLNKGHAAILNDYVNGEGIVENFINVDGDGKTGEQSVIDASFAKSDVDVDDLDVVFKEMPGVTELEMGLNAHIVQEEMDKALDQGFDPAFQIIEAASGAQALPEEQARMYGDLLVKNSIDKIMKDKSYWSYFKDIAHDLIPGHTLFDNIQLSEGLSGLWNAEEELTNVIRGFRAAPREDQERLWPLIKEKLLNDLTETKALTLMQEFMAPDSTQDVSHISAAWAAVDALDILNLGYGFTRKMVQVHRKLNPIKMLNELDNKADAATINAFANMDATGRTAEKASISKEVAYSNGSPINVSSFYDEYTPGLSQPTLDKISEFGKMAGRVADDLTTGLDDLILHEKGVPTPDRLAAEAKFKLQYERDNIENLTVVDRKGNDVIWEGEVHDDSGVFKVGFKQELTIDDTTGILELSERSVLTRGLATKLAFTHGTTKEAIKSAIRADSTSTVVANELKALQTAALAPILGKRGFGSLNPLRKTQLAELDNALRMGSDQRRTWTTEELRGGITGRKLGAAQVEAYFNVRVLSDGLWIIRNHHVREGLKFEGKKGIRVGGKDFIGKTLDTAEEAMSAASGAGHTFWDATRAEAVSVRGSRMRDKYDHGKVLVRLHEDFKAPNGERYNMMLVNKTSIGSLPHSVLHYVEGYIPRINEGYYFVKEVRSVNLNGTIGAGREFTTLRQFDNRKEADIFTARMEAEHPNKRFVTKEHRQIEQEAMGSSPAGSGGGLYTGARGQDAIPFGLPESNESPAILNSIESVSRNISNLGNFVSRNEWKMGMIKQWENTRDALFPDIRPTDMPQFGSMAEVNTANGRFLKEMQDNMLEWFGYPDRSELLWEEQTRSMYEWAINKGFKRDNTIASGLNYISQKDPIAAARSAAFHTMLGSLNPVHYWVQAQGSATSLAVAGIHAPKAILDQTVIQLTHYWKNETYRRTVAKLTGWNWDEYNAMMKAWDLTGLEQSILTNADYAATLRNQGLTSAAISRIADMALFPYRAGELINRRTGFSVAYQESKRAGLDLSSRDVLKEIMNRTDDLTLSMSKGSGAAWQKGIFSLATQFMSPLERVWEKVILGADGSFTGAERGKIMIAQLALYGTAGVPLADFAIRQLHNWFGNADQTAAEWAADQDEELMKLATDGMWGYTMITMFGSDFDIGKRGALSNDVESFVLDIMWSEASIGEKVMGVFGQVPHRIYKAYREISPMVLGAVMSRKFPTPQTVRMAISSAASVLSSWSNVDAALGMHYMNMTRNSLGYPEDDPDGGFTLADELIRGFGFKPSPSSEIRSLNAQSRLLEEYRKKRKDEIVNQFWNYTQAMETTTDPRRIKELQDESMMISNILLSLLPTEDERDKVWKAAMTEVTSGKTSRSKAIDRWIKNFADGRTADFITWRADMAAKGIIQIDEFKSEDKRGSK